jgi:hypothetical protein
MAVFFIFRTVTHDRHISRFGERLQQPEQRFLAMILNRFAAIINRAIHEKLASILLRKLAPRKRTILKAPQ